MKSLSGNCFISSLHCSKNVRYHINDTAKGIWRSI